MVVANGLLRAFYSVAGAPRARSAAGPVAPARPGFVFSAAKRARAPTLFLRHVYFVAHSQNPQRNPGHRAAELGSGNLALVPRAALRCRGRDHVSIVDLPANAGGGPATRDKRS